MAIKRVILHGGPLDGSERQIEVSDYDPIPVWLNIVRGNEGETDVEVAEPDYLLDSKDDHGRLAYRSLVE